ncbi:hypothetical protein [uncultured Intestinimonas sp.]|uniref:hypothetical protein n=1 Tax=uncultured Intestinimonas sp. TaxID=1689265 RepID=UPI0025E444C3|nr:hypothetical protein [uncultured Intestinimonas sp.]
MRLGRRATAWASSRTKGTRRQAMAKGVEQFTSTAKAAAAPPREARGTPSRFPRRSRRALALARSTVPASSGGGSLSWAARAQYSSVRFIDPPPPLRR